MHQNNHWRAAGAAPRAKRNLKRMHKQRKKKQLEDEQTLQPASWPGIVFIIEIRIYFMIRFSLAPDGILGYLGGGAEDTPLK